MLLVLRGIELLVRTSLWWFLRLGNVTHFHTPLRPSVKRQVPIAMHLAEEIERAEQYFWCQR